LDYTDNILDYCTTLEKVFSPAVLVVAGGRYTRKEVMKALAFALFSNLSISGAAAEDQDLYNVKRRTSPKHPCHLCIDEDSIVGAPEKDVSTERTCGSMQLEGYDDMESGDEMCQLIQNYAEYCSCRSIKEKDIQSLEEEVSSIDIRPRDFDTGFRENNTESVDVRQFDDDNNNGKSSSVPFLEDDDANNIDIRSRDFDTGFRQKNAETIDVKDFDDDDNDGSNVPFFNDNDDTSSSIEIRPRDFDKGFRENSTKIIDENSLTSTNETEKSKIFKEEEENSNNEITTNTTTNKIGDDGQESTKNSSSLLSHKVATISGYVFLFFLVFGLSATTPVSQVHRQLGNKPALFTGFLMQFVFIPFMGFLLVLFFKNTDAGFTQAMGLILLVTASSPGGSYSNWWCSIFNADVALSVAMTFVSTFLSVAMLPLNLIMYSKIVYGGGTDTINNNEEVEEDVTNVGDYGTMFITLGLILVALLTGYYASSTMPTFWCMKIAEHLAFLSGMGLILVSVLLSSVGTEANFWNQDWRLYIGISILNLVAAVLTHISSRRFARLKKPECVALSVECCYKNTSIAMSMALAMFPDPEEKAQALAITIIYTLLQKVAMLVYCLLAWKAGWTNAPANESFWDVLTRSYGKQHEKPDVQEETVVIFYDNTNTSEKEEDGKNDASLSQDHSLPPKDDEYDTTTEEVKGDVANFHTMIKQRGYVQAWSYGPPSSSKWWNNLIPKHSFRSRQNTHTPGTQIAFPKSFGDV